MKYFILIVVLIFISLSFFKKEDVVNKQERKIYLNFVNYCYQNGYKSTKLSLCECTWKTLKEKYGKEKAEEAALLYLRHGVENTNMMNSITYCSNI